ncbi:MAG: AlpA family phage regulatory protein [Burkholderiales bacterium]|nr:AlpA family phage regulatory protein [Burkholderiales bacterium]
MRNQINAVATTVSVPPPPSTEVSADRQTGNVVSLPETGFLRQPQVLVFVPISRSTLWRRIQAGTFPGPVKLSARVTAWRAEDVRRWIAEQGVG